MILNKLPQMMSTSSRQARIIITEILSKHWLIQRYRQIISIVLACLVGFATFGVSSWAIASPLLEAAPSATAESLFSANCAACHAKGGNIIRRGKNLKQKALSRYGYDSAENIAALVRQGKGAMPAYADRLSEAEIGAIAQYVLTQAEAGW